MKKVISVLLSILLVLGTVSISSFAFDNELKLDVATDVHFFNSRATKPITSSTDADPFGHIISTGKMAVESKAILAKFLENAANDDSDFVVFTGDITDNAWIEEQRAVTEILEEFERTSGKSVICSIGNHDKYANDNYRDVLEGYDSQFKTVYANLGYDLADVIDTASASYTADLKGDYRIICIDTNNFDQSRFDWIEKQVAKAKEDGKHLISVSHHSLFPHYTVQQIASTTAVPKKFNLADKYIEWGIRFNLSGHTHELDIASHSNTDGVVYDISSGALTTNPACYRTVNFSDKNVQIDTEYIDSIDYSLIPDGLCAEAESLIKTDFRAYAKRAAIEGAKKEFGNFVSPWFLCDALKLNPAEDGEIIDIITQAVGKVQEAVKLPIYGENGIEKIANSYGYELPQTEYNDLLTVLGEAYAAHCSGNENIPTSTPFGKMAFNAVSACLIYGLDTVTPQQYTTLIKFLLSKTDFNFNIPDEIVNVATGTVLKTESIQFILKYVAAPIADDFLSDQSPEDISLTLENYGNSQEKEIVENIFNSIIRVILAVFSVISNFVSNILG